MRHVGGCVRGIVEDAHPGGRGEGERVLTALRHDQTFLGGCSLLGKCDALKRLATCVAARRRLIEDGSASDKWRVRAWSRAGPDAIGRPKPAARNGPRLLHDGGSDAQHVPQRPRQTSSTELQVQLVEVNVGAREPRCSTAVHAIAGHASPTSAAAEHDRCRAITRRHRATLSWNVAGHLRRVDECSYGPSPVAQVGRSEESATCNCLESVTAFSRWG